MIGLDTDMLLRLWLNDAPAQNRRSDDMLAEYCATPGALLVSDVVLAEALSTLSSAYGQGKPAQLQALVSLLGETAPAFEDRAVITQGVTMFELGNRGFSDCLVAARHQRPDCQFTAIFEGGMRDLLRRQAAVTVRWFKPVMP